MNPYLFFGVALVVVTLLCIEGWTSRVIGAIDRRTDVLICNRREIEAAAKRLVG